MRSAFVLLAVAVAAVLHGCSGEPVRTVVIPPRNPPAAQAPKQAPIVQSPTPVAPAPASPAEIPAPPEAPTAAVPSPPPGPLPTVRNPGDPEGARLLALRSLQVPVVGIPPAALADSYEQDRGMRKHEAIDIMAPAGTPVVAIDDGKIVKLFNSKPGGLTIYQFDPQRQLAYYYGHLQRYDERVSEGMNVKRGEVIGYVGSTGNADPKAPHLHFAIFKLKPGANWWQGDPVNPYPALSRAAPSPAVAVAR